MRSTARWATYFGSACWAITCFEMISMTLVFGEICAMTPSMVTKPRASMVTDDSMIMFWSRNSSMISVITMPTLMSFSSAVLYSSKSRDSASSSAPWSTGPVTRTSPMMASFSR